jgi:hypothetical protein
MLKETDMTKIEAILGMEGGALKVAIESDDSKEIVIPTGQFVDTETHQVFSNEQLTERETTLKKTHEKAGAEMLVKEYKRTNNLEFEGKGLDKLIDFTSASALTDAKLEPDAKILELQGQNTALINSNEAWEVKHDNLLENNKLADTRRTTDNNILGFMGGEYSVNKTDLLTIFNSKHEIAMDGDTQIIKRGGSKLEDGKTYAPLTLEVVVGDFVKGYAKTPEGGNGGGDNGGGSGGGSLAVFRKQKEDAGMTYGSDEYMRAEKKAIADGTLVLT